MAIYSSTPCTIFQTEGSFTYFLLAGIKQGLPLFPWLFLFYINDIFDLFNALYNSDTILETMHLLIHVDDTTIIATSRELAEAKMCTLLTYCSINHISLQLSKCEFIVVNGNADDKTSFVLERGTNPTC